MSISNLSLKSSEAFKAVNHCSVRLLALMKRYQPSVFYGNSRDQISSYCSVSQEAAENGFPQQRWPCICSIMIRVQTTGNLSCVAFSNTDIKIMLDTMVIRTPGILAGLFWERNMAFYFASPDTAQIKLSATIPAFLWNGCAGSLPILFLCASAAALAKRCLILFKLSGLGNGAVSVFVVTPSAPSQSWRILQIS